MATAVVPFIRVTAQPNTESRRVALAWGIVAAVIITVLLGLGWLLGSGGKILMVKTPSMGQAAPVGSLLVDRPVALSSVRAGDIVTYAVADRPGITYTHRVVGINADSSLTTKGDINGAIDPWPVTSDMLLGSPALIVPGAGWLVTALPVLLLGSLLIWFLTGPFTDKVTRSSLRLAGLALVFSYAAFLYKPFVNLDVLTNVASAGSVEATVVSTGLFPVQVSGPGGAAVTLSSGEVGTLHIHDLAQNGYYQVAANLHLPWTGWVIVAAICAVPLLIAYTIGRNPEGELA
ncbi:S26 family signal peptidase [Frigoribacterium sp. CFBP 8751]|uniref:S26 family signal peptidase n=1 Tax=Frigoribacterium sp. CFBP 8751 TaxID=2775277 RepID=UPI00177ACEE5|nr:S26 family signal peptidase [Frigoribacterium sp. CFBP 8751]MBD8540618.1 S26 family signal peptidase [Frigoribacterium sp. CFBP 8751]